MINADSVSELYAELTDAAASLDEADRQERSASMQKTEAINRLNAAQKAFDEVVAVLKNEAHFDSDWRRQERRRQGIDR